MFSQVSRREQRASIDAIAACRCANTRHYKSHLGLALGVAIVLLWITGSMTNNISPSNIDQRLSNAATITKQRLDGEITHINGLIKGLSHSASVLEALSSTKLTGKERMPFSTPPLALPVELEILAIHNLQGRAPASSGLAARLADLQDDLLAEIITSRKPAVRLSIQAGATHYLLGYPVMISPDEQLQGVVIAELNLARLIERVIDMSTPLMMAEVRLESGESLLRLGSRPDGVERRSVSLALGKTENLPPALSLELSLPNADALHAQPRLHPFFSLLLFLVVGISAYIPYRITHKPAVAPSRGSEDAYLSNALDNKHLQLKHRAFMASSDGIMIVSMSKDTPIVQTVNPAYELITGYAAAEAIGHPPGKLHNDDKDQAALRELKRAIANQQAITVTLRNYRKDGSLFWNKLSVSPVHDSQGVLTHYLGILNDVTAQKNAEQETLASVRRLDVLSAMSVDGLLTLDTNSRVSYVNNAFLRAFGLSLPNVMGLELQLLEQHLARCCDSACPYPRVEDCHDIHGTKEIANGEAEIQLIRPQRRILLRTIRQGSHETSLLLYFQDITKARELEEIKSEFLATAAHELRTPMTSILGFSELLLQRNFDALSSRKPLEIIVRQARRATNLLNELLDLARIEARRGKDFQLTVEDLRLVVEGVVASIPEAAGRVGIDAPGCVAKVNVDKQKIHQALSNLLGNALKFSSLDSPIAISIKICPEEKPSHISVAFRDQGIGMSDGEMARFGERFWRAEPSGAIPGAGLGISLVKEIAQLHGGSLEVSSKTGDGSCVTLYLPALLTGEIALATQEHQGA